MKKTIFLQLFIFLLTLTIVLPNLSFAANLVTKKGVIIQKDEQSLVMESNQDLNFWQYLKQLLNHEKVKYVVFNKSLTEVKKTSGSVFSRKTEIISFADLKVGDSITVKGELLKKASKEENGEINANLITTVFLTRTTRGPIVINGTTITSSSVISLDTTDLTKEDKEEVVAIPNLPWIKTDPVVTQPDGVVYKSKECANDGEPILQISAIMGITANEVPTECCKGLELCLLAKNDTNNIINYKGFSAIVKGYCKTSCPAQDNSDVLLPQLDATKSLWDRLIGLFKGSGSNECSKNEDCVNKYCLNNKFNCNYYCSTAGKCTASDVLLKTQCEDDIECILVNDSCMLTNVIIAGNNDSCVCDNGICKKNTSVSTTTRPGEVILTCEKDTECGWCNFNCLTQSEKNNLKNMGVTCNTTSKPGFKCSCENKNCKAIPDLTPTTIKSSVPIIINPIIPTPEEPIVNPPSIISPVQPITPPTTLSTTTTTVGGCQGYYMNNDETGAWCDKCSSVSCGDGICNCREKYPWEKYFGQPGGIQIALYSIQNNAYCASDCQSVSITPTTQNPPVIMPPTTTTITIPVTPPTTIINPGYCTMDWIPVCGMDGVIYSNDCFAKNVGVEYCRFFTDLGNMICQCN